MNQLISKMENLPLENKEVYCNFLKQVYSWVSHSGNLLALTGVRIKDFHLKKRFFEHTGEEFGHELLAKNDLKKLGHDISEYPEFQSTKHFYRNQYYLIQNEVPEAFLGYVFALEGLAVGYCKSAYERVVKVHGDKTGEFFRVHAEEDPGHLEDAFKVLNAIDPNTLVDVENSFIESCDTMMAIMDDCAKNVGANTYQMAA